MMIKDHARRQLGPLFQALAWFIDQSEMAEVIDTDLAFKALRRRLKRAGHNAGVADENIEPVVLAKNHRQIFPPTQIAQIHGTNGRHQNAVQAVCAVSARRASTHIRTALAKARVVFRPMPE